MDIKTFPCISIRISVCVMCHVEESATPTAPAIAGLFLAPTVAAVRVSLTKCVTQLWPSAWQQLLRWQWQPALAQIERPGTWRRPSGAAEGRSCSPHTRCQTALYTHLPPAAQQDQSMLWILKTIDKFANLMLLFPSKCQHQAG